MHEAVGILLAGSEPVSVETWHSFWDSLKGPATAQRHADALGLLGALQREQLPDHRSVGALLQSLNARRAHPATQDAVNIVGSGGGPPTFNLSTTAAVVAAALGVRVVKSGSRGYSSRFGSVDALKLIGVPLARSDAEVEDALDRFGIAFPGAFAYPRELALLAQRVYPLDWKQLGAFVNRLGPFLAAVPARHQLTGLSDQRLRPLYQHLAANHLPRRLWLCDNAAGVDELVSFEVNRIWRSEATELLLHPRCPGSLADLQGETDSGALVRQIGALVAGQGPAPAIESICLNAACMAVMSGVEADWDAALAEARQAIASGAATALLTRLRIDGAARAVTRRRPIGARARG